MIRRDSAERRCAGQSAPVLQAMNRQELAARLDVLRRSGTVRLDDEESEALAYALDNVPASEIALFGSRVEPGRRGGDIDVLVRTDEPAFETSQAVAVRFFSRCEEKIDVVVLRPGAITPEQQEFLSRIHKVSLT